jgi:hypothetical protein
MSLIFRSCEKDATKPERVIEVHFILSGVLNHSSILHVILPWTREILQLIILFRLSRSRRPCLHLGFLFPKFMTYSTLKKLSDTTNKEDMVRKKLPQNSL